jgi:hypothetical protein
LNQIKKEHVSLSESSKYLNRRQNNIQNQQAHHFERSYLQSPLKQINAQAKNPEIMKNLVAADENPYDNSNQLHVGNQLQVPQSQKKQISSLGYLTGTPQNPNQLLAVLNIQNPESKTSIDDIARTFQDSLLNPNDQGRFPLQNQNSQTSYSHGQILNCPYQEQLYGPEYQVNNPSIGQSSAKTNQMGTINNSYDPYYYNDRGNTTTTLQSHDMTEKVPYSEFRDTPTQPSLNAYKYPSTGSYQPNTVHISPDQWFCDDFSQLQIRDPHAQLPSPTLTPQTWNEVSGPSQDYVNAMYYDNTYQKVPCSPTPNRIHPEQSYYYAPKPQYAIIEREPTPIGEVEGYSNFNAGPIGSGYTPGDKGEKKHANQKKDLGCLAGTNFQNSNWNCGRFDGVPSGGNDNEQK